ncbi:exodeoxyribonuclease V subunit gamma, partial [Psychrobacter sp. 1Y4]
NTSNDVSDSNPDTTAADELDRLLNKAMRQTKLAQKKQFPPAPLWQAVFETLQKRRFSEHPQLIGLPTKAQYEAMAHMFGHSFGQLGQLDNQTVSTLANMLGLDTSTAANDMSDRTQALTRMVRDTVFNIGEIDVEGMLVYQVRHPAKAFLRSQKVHVVQGEEAMAHQEPLFLDHLTTYQIKDHLIK